MLNKLLMVAACRLAATDAASGSLVPRQAEDPTCDADYAEEASNLTRDQILLQAGTAMLAQANMAPQSVLSPVSQRNA